MHPSGKSGAPKRRAIPRQSLPQIIANDLRERILNGELTEGETIRQEMLADQYEVSRMPIREALKRLDAEGLVQLTNNRGATVTMHSLEEIGEIFDVRTLIEVDLFRQSIPNMSEADYARCDTILNKMEDSHDADDVGHWGELNYDFHGALYAAAGKNLTNELLQRINLQADRYVRMHLSVMEKWETAKIEHRNLLSLAQQHKIDEACELLTQHIQDTKDQLLALVSSNRAAEKA